MVYEFKASHLDKLMRLQNQKDSKTLKDWLDCSSDRISPDASQDIFEHIDDLMKNKKDVDKKSKEEIIAMAKKYDKDWNYFTGRMDDLLKRNKKGYVRLVVSLAMEYDKERTEWGYNKKQAFNWFFVLAEVYSTLTKREKDKTYYFLCEIAKAYMNDQLRAGEKSQIPDWAMVPAQEGDMRAECLMAWLWHPKFPLTEEVDFAKSSYWWDRAKQHGILEEENWIGTTPDPNSSSDTHTDNSTLAVFGSSGEEMIPVIDGIKFL